jgi:ribosomal protein S18 acetylase RimI-like enzyme
MLFGRPWAFERGTMWVLDFTARGGTSITPVAPAVAATFGEVHRGDAAALAAAMGLSGADPVVARLEGGRRCFGAWVAGQLVAYGWVSSGEEEIGELERTFRLPPGEHYIWDCATVPALRGKRLYSALLGHIAAALRDEGARRVWIGASLRNQPSVRGFAAAGFLPVITLTYLRLLGWHRVQLAGDPSASPHLVAALRQALSAPARAG